MSVQKDFHDIELMIYSGQTDPNGYRKKWDSLKKWCTKHAMFGPYGYDFENDKFLREPEDPSQMELPFGR